MRRSKTRRVDAVAIATPPRTHYTLAAQAIEAGKHVLVEKPLAESYEIRRAISQARAKRRGVRLMTDHTFLYTGSVEKLRALRESGELGHIYYIDSVRVNLGLFQESNVVWDLAPHDVSIINYVLGEEPQSVSLQLARLRARRNARRRVSHDVVSERMHRSRASELALAGQGSPHDDLGRAARWRSGTTSIRTKRSTSTTRASCCDPSSSTLQQQMVSYRLGDLQRSARR